MRRQIEHPCRKFPPRTAIPEPGVAASATDVSSRSPAAKKDGVAFAVACIAAFAVRSDRRGRSTATLHLSPTTVKRKPDL
jgi:hypothetical protein